MKRRVAPALLLALLMSGHLSVTSAQGADDQAKREVQNRNGIGARHGSEATPRPLTGSMPMTTS